MYELVTGLQPKELTRIYLSIYKSKNSFSHTFLNCYPYKKSIFSTQFHEHLFMAKLNGQAEWGESLKQAVCVNM